VAQHLQRIIAGGIGVYSDITGTAVERATGGPVGSPSVNGSNLTGGGGGGFANVISGTSPGGTGGSGVVILRVPSNISAIFSANVASRSYSVTGYNIYEVQQTTTTNETVTFYEDSIAVEYLVVAGGGGGGGTFTNFGSRWGWCRWLS
jgi:hypothetical protein